MYMDKKIVILNEKDLHNIVNSVINEVSLSYEKKKVINMLYKKTSHLTSDIYSDDDWHSLHNLTDYIVDLIGSNGDVSIWCENGGYWKPLGEFPNYKEYMLKIKMLSGVEINGSIKCHAAGTIKDTFSRYDITMTLY